MVKIFVRGRIDRKEPPSHRFKSRSKSREKSKVKCFYCGKEGHMKNKRFKRIKDEKQRKHGKGDTGRQLQQTPRERQLDFWSGTTTVRCGGQMANDDSLSLGLAASTATARGQTHFWRPKHISTDPATIAIPPVQRSSSCGPQESQPLSPETSDPSLQFPSLQSETWPGPCGPDAAKTLNPTCIGLTETVLSLTETAPGPDLPLCTGPTEIVLPGPKTVGQNSAAAMTECFFGPDDDSVGPSNSTAPSASNNLLETIQSTRKSTRIKKQPSLTSRYAQFSSNEAIEAFHYQQIMNIVSIPHQTCTTTV
ncbi:hypothetical protein M9H77_21059 [Catharanthus roseus]|uniref:Uncharacterized protein n=1 Tax=Catharanthus roseus TaxID=4058 RepID=A0ACC0ALY3_CATRO|nr:hypothetical protein M9H77_21059 [Catharanthus roseus]